MCAISKVSINTQGSVISFLIAVEPCFVQKIVEGSCGTIVLTSGDSYTRRVVYCLFNFTTLTAKQSEIAIHVQIIE
jgi:hypothetical protein